MDLTAGTQFYCWITGRFLFELPNMSYSDTSSYWNTSFISKRWFRLEPDADGFYTVYLKAGCLYGTSYNDFYCQSVPATGIPTANDYQATVHNLEMAVWEAPTDVTKKRVGVDQSLLIFSSVSSGVDSSDDDNFDGNPLDSTETANSANCVGGCTTDYRDNNQGTQALMVQLESTKQYFIEVYATSANNDVEKQMEGRFRVHACQGTYDDCNDYLNDTVGDPGGLGALDDW
jgi:hypothetical protein